MVNPTATRAAHQAHGAMGMTREYPLHHSTRRLWAWRHEAGSAGEWAQRVGRAANQGDLRLTYTFAYTETDAVLSVFSYSDFGRNGGTNVMGHFIALDYVPFPHVTLTLKNHFVNFINRPAGLHNPTQSRFQADVVLSF